MMPGEVFRIGTFMPSSQDVVPEEVTIRWREGRRDRSLVAQIL